MRLIRMMLVAAALTFAVGAGAAEKPAAGTPAASKPAPPAKPKRHRANADDARQACLKECERRNMTADCVDAEGNLMPCPCDCD